MMWKNTIRKSPIVKGRLALNDTDDGVFINHEKLPSGYEFMEEELYIYVKYDLVLDTNKDGISLIVDNVLIEGYVDFLSDDGNEQKEKQIKIEVNFDEISELQLEIESFTVKGSSYSFKLAVDSIEISLFYNQSFEVELDKSSVDYIYFKQA